MVGTPRPGDTGLPRHGTVCTEVASSKAQLYDWQWTLCHAEVQLLCEWGGQIFASNFHHGWLVFWRHRRSFKLGIPGLQSEVGTRTENCCPPHDASFCLWRRRSSGAFNVSRPNRRIHDVKEKYRCKILEVLAAFTKSRTRIKQSFPRSLQQQIDECPISFILRSEQLKTARETKTQSSDAHETLSKCKRSVLN